MRFCPSHPLSEDLPLAASLAERRSLSLEYQWAKSDTGPQVPWMPRSCYFPANSYHTYWVSILNCLLGMETALNSTSLASDLPSWHLLSFSPSSWSIAIAQTKSSYSPEILGNKGQTQDSSIAWLRVSIKFALRTDLTFESDRSHKFIKCPGDCDSGYCPNSFILDSQVQPYSSRLTLHPSPPVVPDRGGMSGTTRNKWTLREGMRSLPT